MASNVYIKPMHKWHVWLGSQLKIYPELLNNSSWKVKGSNKIYKISTIDLFGLFYLKPYKYHDDIINKPYIYVHIYSMYTHVL